MDDLSRTQNRTYSTNLIKKQTKQKMENKTLNYLELVREEYDYGPESSVDDMDDDEINIKIRRTSTDSDQDSGAFSLSPSPDNTESDLVSPDLVLMANREMNTGIFQHNYSSQQGVNYTSDQDINYSRGKNINYTNEQVNNYTSEQNINRVNSQLLLSCLHEARKTSMFTSYPSVGMVGGHGGDRRHSLLVTGINQGQQRYQSIWTSKVTVNGHHVYQS